MKVITGRTLCKILEAKGWELKTIHGSHHIYMKAGRKERISVPVHSGTDLKMGLLKSVMKIAEVTEDDL